MGCELFADNSQCRNKYYGQTCYIHYWTNPYNIIVDYEQVEECEEFCYLVRVVTKDGGRDREILIITLGKATAAFAKFGRILCLCNVYILSASYQCSLSIPQVMQTSHIINQV